MQLQHAIHPCGTYCARLPCQLVTSAPATCCLPDLLLGPYTLHPTQRLETAIFSQHTQVHACRASWDGCTCAIFSPAISFVRSMYSFWTSLRVLGGPRPSCACFGLAMV